MIVTSLLMDFLQKSRLTGAARFNKTDGTPGSLSCCSLVECNLYGLINQVSPRTINSEIDTLLGS